MSEPTKATTEELDEMAIKAARLSTEQLLDALDLAERTGEWWPEDGLHAAIRSRVAGYEAMAEAVTAAKKNARYLRAHIHHAPAWALQKSSSEECSCGISKVLRRFDTALARVERDEEA